MKTILIAGGTGLIGTNILQTIDPLKYRIKILTRNPKPTNGNVSYHKWDVDKKEIDPAALDADHLINLTGAGIADKRWTHERKKLLIDSRVNSTLLIKNAMQDAGKSFDTAVSASAIGYYGDRGAKLLDENTGAGNGFMSTCCKLWEDASGQLEVVSQTNKILRVGVVLSKSGGALPKMLLTKSIGLYNYFGDGSQFYSWIHIDDISRAFIHLIEHPHHKKIYNGVSPSPITNKVFAQTIRDTIGFGVVIPAPRFALRLTLGEMANVVLNSNKVTPTNLLDAGFDYKFSDLSEAINDLL